MLKEDKLMSDAMFEVAKEQYNMESYGPVRLMEPIVYFLET